MKRIIITGSREFTGAETVYGAIRYAANEFGDDVILVDGGCPTGADQLARESNLVADDYSWTATRHETHETAWDTNGMAVGTLRTPLASLGADLVLAFFKDSAANEGTQAAVDAAIAAGIPVRKFTQS